MRHAPPPGGYASQAQTALAQESQPARQAHPLDIKPLVATNRFKQSTYEVFQPLPIKAYFVASSGGGKSSAAIAAINALFPLYDTFAIFASTIHVDPSFDVLRKRIKDKMKKKGEDTEDEENRFEFDSLADLPRVLHKQHQLIREEKDLGRKTLPQLCVYIDDHLGNMRFNKALDDLFSRGRHIGASCFITSQVYRGASSVIRKNIDCLACFRVNAAEYAAIAEEIVGADVSAEEFHELFSRATASPHHFLWCRLKSRDPAKKFYRNYTHRLSVT